MRVRTRTNNIETVELAKWAGCASIVVVAPHPGDETLGCGHLLLEAFESVGAHVFCLSGGSSTARLAHSRAVGIPPKCLGDMLVEAVRRLGGHEQDITRFAIRDPDDPFRNADDDRVIDEISAFCAANGVRRLLATAPGDRDADHRHAARIAREVVARGSDLSLHFYPIDSRWPFRSWHEDEPALRLKPCDDGCGRQRKRFALAAYRCGDEDAEATFAPDRTIGDDMIDHFVERPEIYLPARDRC